MLDRLRQETGRRLWLAVCIVLAVAFLFFYVGNLAC